MSQLSASHSTASIPVNSIRLGIFTDRSAVFDRGNVLMNEADGRLMAALRARCASLTLAVSRTAEKSSSYRYNVAAHDIDLIPRPYVSSIAGSFFRVPSARRTIRELERRSDVVLVQLPIAAAPALFWPQKPRVYQVCANILTIVDSPYYSGAKRWAASTLARFLDYCQGRAIRHPQARLVAHGEELLEHYGVNRGRAAVSSSLLKEEILSVPRSRPADAPFRLLFVGYFRHEKGVDVLLDAFERLIPQVPNIELEIVGSKDLSEHGIDNRIRETIHRLGGSIRLRGHAAFGPELFRAFADADACVLPSRSEGTPRVLIEARAFGCPIIASRVGGIPTSVTHGIDGLLVPPNDPARLAEAILSLVRDQDLRRRLIDAGIERVRRTTVDDFADAIIAEVETAEATALSLRQPR